MSEKEAGAATGTDVMHSGTHQDVLRRVRTAGSISISPELFEKLYLQPQNRVSGDLRSKFANPTPIGLIGFVLALTPLSMVFMGWRGSGGGGTAIAGSYYFIGGILMFLGGILEWVLGNTFPFVVFASFGGFWSTYGAILTPAFNSAAAYSATGDAAEGSATVGYNTTVGFYLLCWGLLLFIYLICSLRTNIAFVIVFMSLDLAVLLLTGGYFQLANGNANTAVTLIKGGGGCAFVCSLTGWYLLLVQMLASLDFPFNLPVGDLSTFIKSGTERQRVKTGEV